MRSETARNDLETIEKNNHFNLEFKNTKNATPMVSTIHTDENNLDLIVYNLPYNNPLIFTYNSKYYLKTGHYSIINFY